VQKTDSTSALDPLQTPRRREFQRVSTVQAPVMQAPAQALTLALMQVLILELTQGLALKLEKGLTQT